MFNFFKKKKKAKFHQIKFPPLLPPPEIVFNNEFTVAATFRTYFLLRANFSKS